MFRPIALAAATVLCSAAAAQPLTTAFTFQGQLSNGSAAASGTFDLRFLLFDAPTGGTQLGAALCSDNAAVTGGVLAAQLDFGPQFSGQQRFLEVWVRPDTGLDCSASDGFTVLGPRQSLTAMPNAIFSLSAAAASTATSATTATNASQLNGQPASFYSNAANLTGTLPPAALSGSYTAALTLSNTSNIFTGNGAALTGLNAANISTGTVSDARLSTNVARLNGGNAFGNFTNSFQGNVGIGTTNPGFPIHIASTFAALALQDTGGDATQAGYISYRNATGTETAWAGFGSPGDPDFSIVNARPGGDIVLLPFSGNVGIGTGSPAAKLGLVTGVFNGTGIRAESTVATGTSYGVHGLVAAGAGAGVIGEATSTTGFAYGVYGETSGVGGAAGIHGESNASSGFAHGVVGVSRSSDGKGVLGENTNASGRGVYGWANNSSNSGTNYGVYGETRSLTSGFGVFSIGRLSASGTKSFRIDHPADPKNKYLFHYCSEAPQPQNFYNGTVTLDDAGEAVVVLPDYFAAINTDPRYTLTAVGGPMPLLHIAEKIAPEDLRKGATIEAGEGAPIVSFRIAGGAPNGEVSWEVKAIRNDRWVREFGAPVEVEKRGSEKGTYQHPELYGQPPENTMNQRMGAAMAPQVE